MPTSSGMSEGVRKIGLSSPRGGGCEEGDRGGNSFGVAEAEAAEYEASSGDTKCRTIIATGAA